MREEKTKSLFRGFEFWDYRKMGDDCCGYGDNYGDPEGRGLGNGSDYGYGSGDGLSGWGWGYAFGEKGEGIGELYCYAWAKMNACGKDGD